MTTPQAAPPSATDLLPELPAGFTAAALEEAVRGRYSEVSREPAGKYGFRVGRAYAEALGYPARLLDLLPAGLCEAFTGVATPSLHAEVRPGDTVVDLGCGGGLDLALLAWMVGPRGRAIGIDSSPGMAELARKNLSGLQLRQAEVREAPAHQTGLPDACADWVVANGILNLSPAKEPILEEVRRILRPGGRFLLAETTLGESLPEGKVGTLDDWFR